MTLEGVTFVDDAVRMMSREEFVERHKDCFWQDRKEADRVKMLEDAYDIISR
ncbi:MAG: hypothetical protein IKD25_07645 [Bacteroidaceae bacterium]|nr:hypothetical protein [Bacteroidaceae bacterium]